MSGSQSDYEDHDDGLPSIDDEPTAEEDSELDEARKEVFENAEEQSRNNEEGWPDDGTDEPDNFI